MSVAGGRRVVVLYFFLVAFLVFPALQIWVCRDCKAGAARVFPGLNGNDTTSSVKRKKSRDVEEMFEKFFNGRRDLNLNDTTGKGFDDNKRRVPSCPDPLHN